MKSRYNTFNPRKYESHALIYSFIYPNSTILDIGCATGYMAQELQKKKCKTWGIDIDENAVNKAKHYLEKGYIASIDDINTLGLKKNFFDYILLQDVLEHIVDGEAALECLKKYLKKDGKILISTPNIAHITPRLNLLCGKFDYTDTGVMDKTHVHFYTRNSLVELLKRLHIRIDDIKYSADFGQIPFFGRYLRHIPKIVQYAITSTFPTLLGVQIVVICQK